MEDEKKSKKQLIDEIRKIRKREKKLLKLKKDCTEEEDFLKRSTKQLQNLSAHLHTTREEERARISREIQEELGQILTIVQFDLNWVQNQLSKNQKALKQKLQSTSQVIDSIIEWVRKISQELRPSLLDHLGLGPAMEWELNEFKKRSGIKCSFISKPPDFSINDHISTSLFRILQEALSNVSLHSQATYLEVVLEKKSGWISLKIRDNGVGIPDDKLTDTRSIGLTSIQERVRLLNGRMEISGVKNKGTTVTVKLPQTGGGE